MRSIRILGTALRTTPAVVNWVAGSSLAILLMKILVLNAIPQKFKFGYELGQLTENVLAATVAAYVFFVISYQLPQSLERKAVAPSIAMLTTRVTNRVFSVLHMLNFKLNAVEGKAKLPQPVTVETVRNIFKNIAPNDKSISSDELGRPISWFVYMVGESAMVAEGIDQVWRYARFIDAELAALLDDVRLSQHAEMMARMREYEKALIGGGTLTIENSDLSVYAETYFLYYEAAHRLQEYCIEFRSLYGIT
jgi:hypothetical protein